MMNPSSKNENIKKGSSLHHVGLGLRSRHYKNFIEDRPKIGWLEIHPENYFCGGLNLHFLSEIRKNYPLSMHGVGLSLGSNQPVCTDHLQSFKKLIDRFEPFRISEHVAWSANGNAHLNDLLPLPYTQETLNKICENIERTQDFFGRKILIENPSTYIACKDNDISEAEFMNAACAKTGCGMLLDINNIYVQSHNHGLNPHTYIDTITPSYVEEIHLAGHIEKTIGSNSLLIDTHNQTVCDKVWNLYNYTLQQTGIIPTLIEWDQDIPELSILMGEADKVATCIEGQS